MNAQQKLMLRIQQAGFELEEARKAFTELERAGVVDDQPAKHFARKRIEEAVRRLESLMRVRS